MGKLKNTKPFSLLFLFLASLFLNILLSYRLLNQSPYPYRVLAVLDGDTIVLDNKARIRLRHVDAPELAFCGGTEAKNFLEKLSPPKTKIDIREQIIDQRGRATALIYTKKNRLINGLILESGWGRYHSDQTTAKETLKQKTKLAQEKFKGIFGKCVLTEPPQKDCLIKGNIDNNSPYVKRYYYLGCPQYKYAIIEADRGESWFCTINEAGKAGYSKAKNCPIQ